MRTCPQCGDTIRKTYKVYAPRQGVPWEVGRCPGCGGAWKWPLASIEELLQRFFIHADYEKHYAADIPPGWPDELTFNEIEADALERRARPPRPGGA